MFPYQNPLLGFTNPVPPGFPASFPNQNSALSDPSLNQPYNLHSSPPSTSSPSPPPHGTATTSMTHVKRRIRSDVKKCRKVYGIEKRDLWCTQCKWKKACTRFLES